MSVRWVRVTSTADVRNGPGEGLAQGPGDALDAPASPPLLDDPRAAVLRASVAELENLSRFERDDVEQRAEQAVAAAETLGLIELALRARLGQADLLRRRGNAAEGGRRAQEIHRWASEHGSELLLARSHFVLTAVFQELGDVSLALEHAVRAVELLGEDALPEARIDHLARLADCLGLTGDVTARDRYDDVLGLAEQLGDIDRQILVLNNRAYCETLSGSFEEALGWSAKLQDLAAGTTSPCGSAGSTPSAGRSWASGGWRTPRPRCCPDCVRRPFRRRWTVTPVRTSCSPSPRSGAVVGTWTTPRRRWTSACAAARSTG
jgi:two-component system cell cycle response regulator